MAKLTRDSFIRDQLAGAPTYNTPELQAMLDVYIARAVNDADYEVTSQNTTFDDLNARQQGIYNRVAANLVWLQIRKADSDDEWYNTLAGLTDAFPSRSPLFGATTS